MVIMFGHIFSKGSSRSVVVINTSAQLVGKFFGAGTTFILSFIIARQFGASGFGDFVKITTFVSFFFLIADFGLNALYLQRTDSEALPSLFGLRTIGSIGLMFISIAVLAFLPQSTSQGYTSLVRLGIIVFSPAIIFQALITSANAVFQKHLRYIDATVAVVAGSAVTLGILWLVWVTNIEIGGGVLGVVALLGGSLTTAIISLWFAHRITPLSITFSFSSMGKLFIASVPLGLTLISNVIYAHADSVVLTLTRASVEVGTYGLAYKVFETILVLPTFFMNAVYPMMLVAHRRQDVFMSLVKKTASVLLVSSIVLFIAAWFFAPYFVLIRPDFLPSILYLRILVLSLPIFFLSSLTMWMLVTYKRQWHLAWIYGSGMLLNIGCNIWLVPQFGPVASAWITVFSEGLILAVSCMILFPILSKTTKA
jgi:O-antigen/teichoic acid export membrane protein